jgi:hypothetical protein
MLERVNARLQAEDMRPVEMIILKWRVSQLLRDIQRKFCKGSCTNLYCRRPSDSIRLHACNALLANCNIRLAEGDMLRGITVASQRKRGKLSCEFVAQAGSAH